MQDRLDLGGFYIESEFFDGDDFYVNAVLTVPATKEVVDRASETVWRFSNQMCYAMNGSSGHQTGDDGAWCVYGENWWSKDGLEIEDEDDVCVVHIVQRTIRR